MLNAHDAYAALLVRRYDPNCLAYEHEGKYVELQTGPAPSQFHIFPVPAAANFTWVEWFKAYQADPAGPLRSPDYRQD